MKFVISIEALGELVNVLTSQLVDAPLLRVVQPSELELLVGNGLIVPIRRVQVEESGLEIVRHEIL